MYLFYKIIDISQYNFISTDLIFFKFFDIFIFLVISIIFLVIILINISIYTLAERKVMASIQRRKGPNVQGFLGILQPFSDGLKLCFKEIILPKNINTFLFFFSPVFFLTLSLSLWAFIPFYINIYIVELPYSLLFFYLISTYSVYGIIFAGWSSSSYYAILGSLRAAAQLISYDLIMGVIYTIIILTVGSANILDIIFWQKEVWLVIPYFPIFLIFLICILAETNRIPFDLPESESELVAGYNVEYSSMVFAMFFLGEYSNMLVMSFLVVSLFFGGCISGFFYFKLIVFFFFFILIRAILPRYRYDQLLYIGWNNLLPFSFSFFFFVIFFLYLHNAFGFNPLYI
jgi:NADH:ubiquinone oxidoreductase subunit H